MKLTLVTDLASSRTVAGGLPASRARRELPILGRGAAIGCGLPRCVPPLLAPRLAHAAPVVRVHRIYHGSLVDGPGRRSVLQVQGCARACVGCHAGATHNPAGGQPWDAESVAEALLDDGGGPRDGVTLLGGEPTEQAPGVLAVARALRRREPRLHLALYSGYTLEELVAGGVAAVRELLAAVELLLDGPFVAALAGDAGEWRGSRNQRLLVRDLGGDWREVDASYPFLAPHR